MRREYHIDERLLQMLAIAPRDLMVAYCLRLAALVIETKQQQDLRESVPTDINQLIGITFEVEVMNMLKGVAEKLIDKPEAKPQDLHAAEKELAELIARLKS